MNYENVLVDMDGPVATITLNRPEKLNAMSGGLLDDLHAALRDLNPGDDVRVVRLPGGGPGVLCRLRPLAPDGAPARRRRPRRRHRDVRPG